MLRKAFWIVAGYLLLFFGPGGGTSVPAAFGAFPLSQAGGKIHVNKTGDRPPDGESCRSGWRSIDKGLQEAEAGDVVEVCDGSTYSENLTMKTNVDLISLRSLALGAGFDAIDVLIKCGETPSQKLPEINGGGATTIKLPGVSNVLIRGFSIAGGKNTGTPNQHGGGVSIDNCENIQLVANCISNNEADNGGGIGILAGKNITLDTNAITQNEASHAAGGGGGIWARDVDELLTTNNLIQSNTTQFDGGGIHTSGSKMTEIHVNDEVLSNEAKNFGGGAFHTEGKKRIIYTNCVISENESLERGGGGINAFQLKKGLDVLNCQVLLNEAGFSGDIGDVEKFSVRQGGGGIRVQGGDINVVDTTFVNCDAALDGGGLVVLALVGILSADTVTQPASATLEDVEFIGCTAEGDGGGLSNQVRTSMQADRVTLSQNTAMEDGGGFHTTCSASGTFSQIVSNNNTATERGGGLYNRSAQADFIAGSLPTRVELNSAGIDGGGLLFQVSEIPGAFGAKQGVCGDLQPELKMNGAVFENNTTSNRGAAVMIRYIDPDDKRTPFFQFVECQFRNNTLTATPFGGAVAIAMSKSPPSNRPSPLRGFFNCTFRNQGTNFKTDIQAGNQLVNYYGMDGCTFELLFPSNIGVELFADSPRLTGANRFFGTVFPGEFGIIARNSTDLQVDGALFRELEAGITVRSNPGTRAKLQVRDSTLEIMVACIQMQAADLDVKRSTFSFADTGISLFDGSTIDKPGMLTKHNTFEAVTTIVDSSGN